MLQGAGHFGSVQQAARCVCAPSCGGLHHWPHPAGHFGSPRGCKPALWSLRDQETPSEKACAGAWPRLQRSASGKAGFCEVSSQINAAAFLTQHPPERGGKCEPCATGAAGPLAAFTCVPFAVRLLDLSEQVRHLLSKEHVKLYFLIHE